MLGGCYQENAGEEGLERAVIENELNASGGKAGKSGKAAKRGGSLTFCEMTDIDIAATTLNTDLCCHRSQYRKYSSMSVYCSRAR